MQRFLSLTSATNHQEKPCQHMHGFAAAQIDVWLCRTNGLPSCEQLIPLLSEQEQKRAIAIRNLVSQSAYIAAHLLLQGVLAKHYGVCRKAQVFVCNVHGKPWLAEHREIHFNLSHTDGMVAVAVSNYPVGIDVEHTQVKEPIAMAQALFAPVEIEHLVENQGSARLFRRYWVAKEACLKAIGVGLGALLGQCVVTPQALEGHTWESLQLDARHIALRLLGGSGQDHDIAVAVELKQRMVTALTMHYQQLRSDELLAWVTECGEATRCGEKSVALAA